MGKKFDIFLGWMTGFRKVTVVLIFYVIIVLSRIFGLISDGNIYATVLRDVTVAYVGANFLLELAGKGIELMRGRKDAKKD